MHTQIDKKKISLVIPFYNEERGVQLLYETVASILNDLSGFEHEIICVDDGSNDLTLSLLIEYAKKDERIRVVELSRNFGKESALTAGIDIATGDAVIPMDADLQDPPELIKLLIEEWLRGAEVVLARRSDRSADTFLKRKTAALFYRFHNKLSNVKIPENVGDYRLMDRVVVEAIKRLPERQRFMKGLFAWVGFNTVFINYKRAERTVGYSKFSGWKLWNFALEGITSFSIAPLKVWTYLGFFGSFISVMYLLFILFKTIAFGVDVPGYASLLIVMLFMGSLQFIGIGFIGEYLGRIYMESKNRPVYIVRKIYGDAK